MSTLTDELPPDETDQDDGLDHEHGRKSRSLFDPSIIGPALGDALRKLDPRSMARNPVMFIVEVGALLTTVLAVTDWGSNTGQQNVFAVSVAVWLWATVLFANFAEAMAEGRGKAQADTLRKTIAESVAKVRTPDGDIVEKPSTQLELGDLCVVVAGEVIPGDGDIVEGIATVDESAITGESAPVIRESGGDRSAVTGGTRVLSDQIVVQITARPGETFLDRMIALVEGADRQKTPNEIALSILLAGLTIIFLLAVVTLQPFAIYSGAKQSMIVLIALLVCLIPTTIGGLLSAIGIAGMDRLVQRNVLAMSGRAVEAAGRREHPAARQDRHHHLRLPPGGRVHPGPRRAVSTTSPRRRWTSSLADETPEGRSIVALATEQFGLSATRRRSARSWCRSPPRPGCRAWTSLRRSRTGPQGRRRLGEGGVADGGGAVPIELGPDRRRCPPKGRRRSWCSTGARASRPGCSASSASRTPSSPA